MPDALNPRQKFGATLTSPQKFTATLTTAGATIVAPVTSVFGRTGDVTAQPGDYDASDIISGVFDPARLGDTPVATPYEPSDLFLRGDGTWVVPPDQSITVADEGVSLGFQPTLNFTGAGVSAAVDAANKRITVTIPGGGGSGSQTPWTSNIDAASFSLDNVKAIGVGTASLSFAGVYVDNPGVSYDHFKATSFSSTGAASISLSNNLGHLMTLRITGSANSSASDIVQLLGTSSPIAILPNGVEAMRFTSAGRVGIGLTNPGYLLDVAGDCNITGTYRVNGTPISTGGAVASVFGRTGAVVAAAGDYTAAQVTGAVSTAGSYADPAWITSLAYSKLAGAPTAASIQTPWLQDINAAGFKVYNASKLIVGTAADVVGALQVTGDAYHTGKILFSPDNTYDIGAAGATRPKNIYMSGTLNVSAGITGGGQYATSASMSAGSGYIKTDVAGVIVYVNHTGGTINGNYGLNWDKTNEQVQVLVGGTAAWNFRGSDSALVGVGTRPTILFDQGATARGRVFQTVATHNVWSSVNGYYDGANFQRDDTSKASAFTQLQSANFSFGYSAAGTGPISVVFPFTFDLANTRLGIGRTPSAYPIEAAGAIYSTMADGSAARVGLQNTNRHWTITNYGTQYSPNGAYVVADETVGKIRLLITNAGYVGVSCPNAIDDTGATYNNTFYCWVNEASNTLQFRVKYSTGTIKTGSIALA